MWKVDNRGENNPSFKGDEAGYGAIHAWVRRRKTKPSVCEKCGISPPRDLANKSGRYLRDLVDWEYLCRKCHMDADGRNHKLIESGKSRKRPSRLCCSCNSDFHPKTESQKYCARGCFFKSRKGVVTNPSGLNGKGEGA